MNATEIATVAENVAVYLGFVRRTLRLSQNITFLTLPVTPWKYTVTVAQDNKTFDILDNGEILTFGNSKLKHLRFSCFFPKNLNAPYIVNKVTQNYCIDTIEKFRTNKEPVQVIISDSPINFQAAINNFSYSEKDGSGDIDFTLELAEYKTLNISASNYDYNSINADSGLKFRASGNSSGDIQDLLRNVAGDFWDAGKIFDVNNLSTLTMGGCFGDFSPRNFSSFKLGF